MWKRIKETQYFFIFSIGHEYEIFITDYLSVWTALFSEKAFLAQLKESNEGLELPQDKEYVQKGVHLLSNIDNLKKCSIKKEENGKQLFITMTISIGFPFNFECKLSKGSEELYFQKVTLPLMKIICDLRESQSELRHLLIKKDSEIEEYKCEGGEIVLRHLKTIAFNDEEHMKKHKVYEDNFGVSKTSTTLLKDAVEILQKNVLKPNPETENLERLEPNIKTEALPVSKTEAVPTIKTETISTTIVEPVQQSVTSVKTETTDVAEEQNVPLITASVSCKQEIKRETVRPHIPRKRSKFNF